MSLVVLLISFALNVVNDIYASFVEQEGIEDEDYYNELIDLTSEPINLNAATYDDLARLRFLRGEQIDAILAYVDEHPMESLNELALIDGLHDYDIRNHSCFFTVQPLSQETKLYGREVFHYATHEILTRADARNIEQSTIATQVAHHPPSTIHNPQSTIHQDPLYAHLRYKFNYQNRVLFGVTLQRPTGAPASELQYGGYVQVNDIGHLQTLVAGNYQASFGQGLVIGNPFHMGKSTYVTQLETTQEGLKKYSSVSGGGLHGAGATLRFGGKRLNTRVTAFYSLQKDNDSLRHHAVGANVSARFNRVLVGVTAVENIYSDSVRYYFKNAAYNQNYFRGDKQFVGGANFRWNQGIIDLFGEVATTQNKTWGVGTQVGLRATPVSDINLLLLYRYYSPTFDNTYAYAFSETSRLNDENGLYLAADITKLNHWRFTAYGDVFRFAGVKYGIPQAPSWGYDAQVQATYIPSQEWQLDGRVRAKQKGKTATYSTRWQFDWEQSGWHLRTRADANIVTDSVGAITYGVSLSQDVQYSFAEVPLALQFRLQGFDARNWNNRIYVYENDVLYAFSSNTTYGLGARVYANIRWQIIPQLALYFKASTTIHHPQSTIHNSRNGAQSTDTDLHLLLRATL